MRVAESAVKVEPRTVKTGAGVRAALGPLREVLLPITTAPDPRLIIVPETVTWPLGVNVCPAMTN